jgi:hypothetical protein
LSVEHGLGRHFNTLSDEAVAKYHKVSIASLAHHFARNLTGQQFSYASSILAILSMSLAKLSVLQLQRRLCGIQPRSRYIKIMYWGLFGTIIIWTLFSTFGLAFHCGAARPDVYAAEKCSNGSLRYAIATVNATTDAALAFSFSPIILTLSAKTRTKVKIMMLLGARTV